MTTDDRPIKLAHGLSLPISVATQTVAAIARKGAGKTYTMMKLVEELLAAGVQVVILDAIGNWFGLRLSKDGTKSSGLDIPILGGYRGDIPLTVEAGALIATTLVESGQSAILDVSQFRKEGRKQFATAFAEELLHLKKDPARKSPIFIVLEEAQLYAPQKADSGSARMLGAFEDLVKLGRNYGIGVGMISQRPQAINKDVLNQTELLIVLQTNGPQERKTIRDWVVENDAEGVDLIAELPKLQNGQAFIWSPGWLRHFGKHQILKKRTFDASATPDQTTAAATKPKPIDLGALQVAMAEAVEEKRANDPKALRAELEQLRAEHKEFASQNVALTLDLDQVGDELTELRKEADRLRGETRDVPVLTPAERMKIDELRTTAESMAAALDRLAENTTTDLGKVSARVQDWRDEIRALVEAVEAKTTPAPRSVPTATPAPRTARPQTPARVTGIDTVHGVDRSDQGVRKIGGGARRMLTAIGFRPGGVTRTELVTLSGVGGGGTMTDYLSILRRSGLIVDTDAGFMLTEAGATVTKDDPRLTRNAVLELHRKVLRGGVGRIWTVLDEARGAVLSRDDVSKLAEVGPGGTLTDYLSILRRRGLLEDAGHGYRRAAIFQELRR